MGALHLLAEGVIASEAFSPSSGNNTGDYVTVVCKKVTLWEDLFRLAEITKAFEEDGDIVLGRRFMPTQALLSPYKWKLA
jgi:Golgi nucleoside diphosphatase